MSNDTTLTIVGNTTAPAELRFTPSGAAVASFTVASTPRTFDKNRNEWVDGETLFMRCSVWREQAENVAESLADKGMRVVVVGRLKQRSYEKDGEKRTVIELEADEVSPSLRYASAKVIRRETGKAGSWNPAVRQQQQPYTPPAASAQQSDPWAQGNGSSEAPF